MMKFICTEPTCNWFGKYCRVHLVPVSKKPGIAKVAQERKEINKEYERVKKEFLRRKKCCEACGDAPATEVHHKRGRVGKLLTDTRFFMAVCRPCHTLIHDDYAFAKANGWVESRHKKENV